MWVCKGCNQTKEELSFPITSAGKLSNTCKICIRERERTREKASPGYHRNSVLKCNFGVTLKEYDELLEEQHNKCAICQGYLVSRKGHLDHCHATNRIRGILCSNCNCGLGEFRDSEVILVSAQNYLRGALNGVFRSLRHQLQGMNTSRGSSTRESGLLNKYGMALDEYDAIFSKQEGMCLICLASGLQLEVDHCHTTHKLRGLLCSRCNVGLGHFKDDCTRLQAAIAYLAKGPIKRTLHNVLLGL